MPNDTTLTSVFDHARQGQISGGEFPRFAAVFATVVEHSPNSHPPGGTETADLVAYANGLLSLSSDKKKLSGELQIWRNIYYSGMPAFFGSPPVPEDAFADRNNKLTVAISVSDNGQVTLQRKLNGNPIGGMPPQVLNATFSNAMYVETSSTGMKSLSFTLGSTL